MVIVHGITILIIKSFYPGPVDAWGTKGLCFTKSISLLGDYMEVSPKNFEIKLPSDNLSKCIKNFKVNTPSIFCTDMCIPEHKDTLCSLVWKSKKMQTTEMSIKIEVVK